MMPNLDPRTYIILALLATLLAIVIFVPPVRLAAASVFAFIASLLGASKVRRKRKESNADPTDDPTTAADDLDQDIDEQTADAQTASGDDLADQLNEQTDPYVD